MDSIPHKFCDRTLRPLICMITMAALSACASLDVKMKYQPPQQTTIPSSITVQKPFQQAWDQFVRKLGQDFFVVNNISKDSRFISISVSHNQAAKFIDCGTLNQKVNSKDWAFNAADNADFDEDGTTVNHRVTGWIGRMNIVVTPSGADTIFEVNAAYGFGMVQTGRDVVRNLIGRVVSTSRMRKMEAGFKFTTKAADEQPFGAVTIRCQATGIWEQLVLDLAR